MPLVNLKKILISLQDYHPKYIDLNLNRMHRLLKDLGDPHLDLPPTIHVAGTNGKGSTIAFLKSILEYGGLKVHAYTSPHLVSFNERIRINGQLITDDYLSELLLEVERINNKKEITFFEFTTATAFLAFSRVKADLLLLEVGLGGRLDATNVVPNILASIITRISFDHEHFLGDTLSLITQEKCGIIKKKTPVITIHQDKNVTQIIKRTSKEYNKFIENEKSKINIQRFKGLGEMNPEELWQTTLDPENRTLLLVNYSNNTKAKSKKDQDLIQILMGDEVAPRKDFIINRALEVSNLDI